MPANPKNVGKRVDLSDNYHDKHVTLDFYTNSAIAIYRGDEDMPEGRVWLDNLEKRALYDALDTELNADYHDTLQEALDLWGKALQFDVGIEELSELITELARLQRGTRKHASNDNLLDEIADAQIILDQLKVIAGEDAVDNCIGEKMDRLRDRIDAEYEEIDRTDDD